MLPTPSASDATTTSDPRDNSNSNRRQRGGGGGGGGGDERGGGRGDERGGGRGDERGRGRGDERGGGRGDESGRGRRERGGGHGGRGDRRGGRGRGGRGGEGGGRRREGGGRGGEGGGRGGGSGGEGRGRGRARVFGGPPRQAWVPRTQSENQDILDAAILPTPPQPARARVVVCGRGILQRQVPESGRTVDDVPQLVQEIQEKLAKGSVECMICYDMVRRSAAVWSCSSCYSIFHLSCIRKWARSPTSTGNSSSSSDANWRCPGCQSVQLSHPAKDLHYTCFCGRLRDPPNDLYLTPHSCGEPCGKPLYRGSDDGSISSGDGGQCPHLCILQCHPGPCPSCKAFAPPRRCPCGKKSVVLRCSDQTAPVTCGQRCGRLLGCGRHRCEETCHMGPCQSCRVTVPAVCFCGKAKEVVTCGEIALKDGDIREGVGIFSCGGFCGKRLSCGSHSCIDVCHPGPCGECELLPGKVKSCYCGKTKLEEDKRGSCLDPIPTCSELCGKLLPCGLHMCGERCHAGDCPPCLVLVDHKCRCGSTSRKVECFKTLDKGEEFTCDKSCGRKKNCGRHRCSDRCCPLSRDGIERFSGDWDPHLCQMSCGKKLRCGQHACQSLCHSGHCPPCLETIFQELACACGKTSLPPPLPCGTPYPSCPHQCMVPQPCGHSCTHTCHFGDCPPCSVPVAKECIGRHVVLRNVPCGSKDIRCNQLCGRTRQCGMHACARTCHPPPCDANGGCGAPGSGSSSSSSSSSSSDSNTARISCGQTCGAPRRDCRHTCSALCHPSSPCPNQRCEFMVSITCLCGRMSATVPCGAGGSSSDVVYEASIVQKLPVPLQPIDPNGKRIPLGQRKIACDEDCEKVERKRVLADAFDVTPPNLDALHFGENPAFVDFISDVFRREPKWVLAVEERFKYLVLGKTKGASSGSSLRVHVFSPMMKDKRDVIRQMAERWKLPVHAAGREPRRFLVVHVTPKSKSPSRILGSKAGVPLATSIHPLAFDSFVDMDPRLVISLFDLPRDADISALVLRFGGECELVWVNDKNALAIFSDAMRAATALRRLDHGSAYHGAVALAQRQSAGFPSSSTHGVGSGAWGVGAKEAVAAQPRTGNPWKKVVAVGQGGSSVSSEGLGSAASAWTTTAGPIPASVNKWNALDMDAAVNTIHSSSGATSSELDLTTTGVLEFGERVRGPANISAENGHLVQGTGDMQDPIQEAVDDWEEAYD